MATPQKRVESKRRELQLVNSGASTMQPPGDHTAEAIAAEMKLGLEDFNSGVDRFFGKLKKLRNAHKDPIATADTFADIRAALLPLSTYLLRAHFGNAQAALVERREQNKLDRVLNRPVGATDAEVDGFDPSESPEAAALLLNSSGGILFRTPAERVRMARRSAPVGSTWSTREHDQYVVVAINETSGDITIDWPGGGNLKVVDLRRFSEEGRSDRWLTRIDTTEEQLKQVPVGSLWRRGNRTYRVTGHRCQTVDFIDLKSKEESSDPFTDFVGPIARKKRVNLQVIDYSQVISVGSIWRCGSHKYRVIEINEVADVVRYRGAAKNGGKFGSGIFGWDHEDNLAAFVGPQSKMKLVAPLPSSKLARSFQAAFARDAKGGR